MIPAYQDELATVYLGDVRECLRALPAESVHMVMTSPPYFGLRDYGTGEWVDGSDPSCDHRQGPLASPSSTLQGYTGPDVKLATGGMPYRDVCGKCGARRQDRQLGLEPSVGEYVAAMVEVFREVRRVLRKDGTLWLNLGDSYIANGSAADPKVGGFTRGNEQSATMQQPYQGRVSLRGDGALKPKDMIGVPWRVAFALQDDGWWLRSDIIWSKPNPMPESVGDRPTTAHEYVFLLSKSKVYHYDAFAVMEEAKWPDGPNGAIKSPYGQGFARNGHGYASATRNLRDVWTITTQAFSEAHFATFPERLVELPVLAGTSARGVCPSCGAPWRRIVQKSGGTTGKGWHDHEADLLRGQNGGKSAAGLADYRVESVGWETTCAHGDLEPVPATVLEPFAGSGTTLAVAKRLGRRAVGIELNPEYLKLIRKRVGRSTHQPLLLEELL